MLRVKTTPILIAWKSLKQIYLFKGDNTIKEKLEYLKKTIAGGEIKKLAEILGIIRQTLESYLNDGRKPGVDIIKKIVEACQKKGFGYVTADWLLFGESENPAKKEEKWRYILDHDEIQIMEAYRKANPQAQKSALSILEIGREKSPSLQKSGKEEKLRKKKTA